MTCASYLILISKQLCSCNYPVWPQVGKSLSPGWIRYGGGGTRVTRYELGLALGRLRLQPLESGVASLTDSPGYYLVGLESLFHQNNPSAFSQVLAVGLMLIGVC